MLVDFDVTAPKVLATPHAVKPLGISYHGVDVTAHRYRRYHAVPPGSNPYIHTLLMHPIARKVKAVSDTVNDMAAIDALMHYYIAVSVLIGVLMHGYIDNAADVIITALVIVILVGRFIAAKIALK